MFDSNFLELKSNLFWIFHRPTGKVVLFGIVAIFWLAAVILIFKIWRTDPVTVELSPKTSFGTIRFQMLNEDHIDSIMDDLEDFLEREKIFFSKIFRIS